MANGSSSEFDVGWAAGKKRAKKDARAEKDLWAIRQSLPTESDYDLGFSVGYEIVTKDTMGPKGGVSVGHYGWLSGRKDYLTFTPREGGHSSGFRGPHAVEQMRYHLRNERNIPTREIDAALNGFRDKPWSGGKRRHAAPSVASEAKALQKMLRK